MDAFAKSQLESLYWTGVRMEQQEASCTPLSNSIA